jgi:hypothetical protein
MAMNAKKGPDNSVERTRWPASLTQNVGWD